MDDKVSEILGDRDPEAVPGFKELKSQVDENVVNLVHQGNYLVAALRAMDQKIEQQHRQQINLIHQLLDRPVPKRKGLKIPRIWNSKQALPSTEGRLKDEPVPKFSFKQIYKIGTFDMDIKHHFKRLELSIRASDSQTDINLISSDRVQEARMEGYEYLHMGAVQVAFKLQERKDLGASVTAVLRDNRWLNFEKSILGAVQADLNSRCAYFVVLPNYPVPLNDAPKIWRLQVQTQGSDVKEQFPDMIIEYRVYYKLVKAMASFPRMKLGQQPGVTTLLHYNPRNHTYNHQPIKWEDVNFPEHWKITGTNE